MNDVIRNISKEKGIPYANINNQIPDNEEYYENDDIHLSAKGSEIQAKAFADSIQLSELLEK